MAKTRRTFTPEFKAQAVRRIADQGKSLAVNDGPIGRRGALQLGDTWPDCVLGPTRS